MKILFESWRKYLTEDEGQYFPWLDELKADPDKWLRQHFQSGNKVGSGAFRITIAPEDDPDFVVKLAKRDRADEMNKAEKVLGDQYPELFPRVYATADDFRWIVMDRVVPLHGGNRELMEEAMIATFPELYNFVLNTKQYEEEQSGYIGNAHGHSFAAFNAIMKSTQEKDEIYEFATQNSDWYNQLLKAIHRYAVDPEDLRQGNIGLDMKTHSLKILDGSVFNTYTGERGEEIRSLGS